MHVPAVMDGGPHQPIAPNDSWTASYTVNQPACTAWYHPHQMGKTAEQVYRGLAGIIIVEDDNSAVLGLPSDYGVDDIPLVLQDRAFDASGQLLYAPSTRDIMRGYRGDVWLTNGQVQPKAIVPRGWVRLRLVNGSNASIYQLKFSPSVPVKVVATDGGLLSSPVEVTTVQLSPAERVELVVDLTQLSPGDTVALQGTEIMDGRTGVFLTLEADTTVGVQSIPLQLTSETALNAVEAVRTRTFTLGMAGPGQLTINGQSMDMNRIDLQVPLNDLEIWEVVNTMPIPHNFHIHATHFVPLDRNGSTANLYAWEQNAYKDTIFVPANGRVRFMVKMTDYTDANTPYMYHCHFLEHEDAGMMGQFVVV
jgi:FtsP/CotA-like multicopper oxidase with cupredoxin domain